MNTTIKILALLLIFTTTSIAQDKPIDYVNPFIDTHDSRWFFFASASRPFGMVSLSPDTAIKGSWKSGYIYDSLHVRSFSHIHAWQMAGIPVMPTTGKLRSHLGMEETKSAFSHETEIAQTGYHKVVLDDYDITAELTSTQRVGFHRYTFPKTDSAYINFHTGAFLAHGDVDSSYVKKVNDYEIEGYSLIGKTGRRPKPTYVYFTAKLDHKIKEFGGWEDQKLLPQANEVYGKNNGAYLRFKTNKKPVLLKVAISYTSIENARKNMDAELSGWDFDKTVAESKTEWNDMLSRIKISGGTKKQKIKFYTDLWHSLLGRKIVSDVDGTYCDMTGPKPLIKQVPLDEKGKPIFPQYNYDAWWGSHWTLNVLWSMVYPEIMDGFCSTMVNMYKDGGLIPRGPSGGNYTYVMIGDPSSSFIATAYNKGIRNYDTNLAYEGLLKNAYPGGIRDRAGYEHNDNPTGGGMEYYVERGYVPEGLKGKGGHKDGASMTLEYAYQDWSIAQMAKAMGKTDDYEHFMKRSENYRNLWNPETGLIHPKNIDGSWIDDFSPIAEKFNTKGFCESNSAIYSNYVPHNMDGLMGLFGGKEKYTDFLISSFNKAAPERYIAAHGVHAKSWVDYENQPSCQMAHLFNFSGAPWLTQKYVREVKEVTFGDITPYGGYNGDEDQGQMGALGVLMAIGLFQMDGGVSINSPYDITSPIFDSVEISLHQNYYPGEKFTIVTQNNSAKNVYIQSAKLNGKNWDNCFFKHDVFANGGKLDIVLGDQPNKAWGKR
ncbi:GH92 family glycosyl hydrolase [Cellulophaga sp. F20128]|uniref:GH92 family glycosyl hydrolase n=1 Tax=Cellulophaga sp. F20128 TaxID=2926413 RepID=UPI001FF21725|nr:GH92 family glycosyl hydrolase [Cellulophaga sp. F20128]MCK0157281.1 GH92 family glycosyl hydrolase [Cellulophaga sp. F20128]